MMSVVSSSARRLLAASSSLVPGKSVTTKTAKCHCRRSLCTVGGDHQLANQQAREDLAACYRGLDYYGMGEGVCNHLTLRGPARNGKGEVMLLIPYGKHWSQVTASCLVGVDIHSKKVVEGEGIAEDSAVWIHTAIHRAMEKTIDCVMHAHPPYATALSCLKNPRLKMVHQSSMRFYGKIGYDEDYAGTGDMGDESERLAQNMAGKEVMVMGNHGLVAAGKSAAVVFDNLYYFERAAMFQMIAEATGRELAEASDKVSQDVSDYYTKNGDIFRINHFKGLKELLQGKGPDFRS
ncbi:adducin-related protein C1289.14-like [Patiria miniata]|uniref:Class II aldolase/adducin N-terminal domain-containing protein n=1 Tax=Patiria miniata TaxID=46514 RepID=A0A914B2T9_PATMI|nr:adducin-related protein C1289.14-like [Patiria miniata]